MNALKQSANWLASIKQTLTHCLANPAFPEFATRIRSEIANAGILCNSRESLQMPSSDCLNSFLTPAPMIGTPSNLQSVSVSALSKFISENKIPRHIALLHSLANIEYSAVLGYGSLLLMPSPTLGNQNGQLSGTKHEVYLEFFRDILSIVDDECRHFLSLVEALDLLNSPFGSVPVNSNIRDDLTKTVGNQLHRLVLVSLLHEGRGLDGGDRVLSKLPKGSVRTILQQIIKEEERHVGLGIKWASIMAGGDQNLAKLIYDVSEITGVKNSPERMDFDKRALAGFKKEWAFYPNETSSN